MATSFLSLFLALFFFFVTPALTAVPRPDHATALLPVDAGFAPRWYMESTPAVPAQLVSRNPRNVLRDGADDGILARDVVICNPGYHSCVEALDPGMCCANDRYCYINENWQARCCSLGVKCRDSKCGADELYCNTTSSTTVPVTTVLPSSDSGFSTTGRGEERQQQHDVTTVTSLVSVSTFAACCNRACSASMFSCESTFGGQCCSYGFKCATGGNCIADPAPATATDGGSTLVPDIPPSCTTSQFACAESDGGGCCNTGSVCTSQTIGATISQVCAPLSDAGSSSSSGGLSSGAKAGIGVGVAVGAAIVIAAVTWVCIRRRRRRSGTTGTNVSAHEMRQSGGAAGDEDTGNSLLVGPPQTPWTPSSAFTDGRDALHGQRVYSDHFPDAGPYTDRGGGDGRVAPNPSLATTPPAGSLPSDGGGRFAGSVPYHPDHILRPVEIGGAEAAQKENTGTSKEGQQADEYTAAGPFELMGSPGSPSPLSPDGESHAMGKGPKG
ncbi:hypothetical protein F5Y01DRAFT_56472 [Xylaria sp. FL0043]|nr:hypothetical protein F5Y01DRAFT_56472 [Xylaria sp. FL0043]